MTYDVQRVRRDFPILSKTVHGKPLVYLDNAATTQKPQAVIDALANYYRDGNANVHRAVHELSEQATKSYEGARSKVASFINASRKEEIIYARGTTEALNLVANTFGRSRLGAGDEVLVTGMEHHSNIVPWQLVCQQTGARLRVLPITAKGELDLSQLPKLLSAKTKVFAFTAVSNALGTVNPVRELVETAHAQGVPVVVDAAQAVPHSAVDVRAWDADFVAFSGHKMYGPTGIGILYGKHEHLEAMPPWQGGGDMIRSVTFEATTYNDPPYRFEAGTPAVADAIGLGAAVDYLQGIGMKALAEHEHTLLQHAQQVLADVPGLRMIGTARERAALVSFVLDGVHPHDIGSLLDRDGIAIRTGHHCAQPVMDFYGVPATGRASFGLYNTTEEVDALASSLKRVVSLFS